VIRDPYNALLELTRREHELIVAGDVESLAGVQQQREQLMAVLPPTPPETARPALPEAARIQAATHGLLVAAKEALTAELAATDRSRDTARGYARSGLPEPVGGSFVRSA
jgi:hypothetical protein